MGYLESVAGHHRSKEGWPSTLQDRARHRWESGNRAVWAVETARLKTELDEARQGKPATP